MNEKEIKKEKIRQKYRGHASEEIRVIPANPEQNYLDDDGEKRVAIYARVSTDDPSQTSSFELQKNHYLDVVSRHPNWKLVDIYADEGITGTSTKHRKEFNRMISDCINGNIDIIVTKSVSRFARNIIDCVGITRKFKNMEPPIGIYFETEGIYSLDAKSEMALSFIAILAQEESHNKSEIMNASIDMRFRREIFLTPELLGYDKDENGNLIINEREAAIVRLIFFLYLYGYTCKQIAETLTKLQCKTKKNNTVWSPGSILQILKNERHCGDIRARKTYTPNYLDHKSKLNRGNRNSYYKIGHHEPIISREDFMAVQNFIENAKYGGTRILPELKVIDNGLLYGFVSIHTRWSGFTAEHYRQSSKSIDPKQDIWSLHSNDKIMISDGEFDFRGYEIVRSQFFTTKNRISVTVSNKNITFSTECIKKLDNTMTVEMLINPSKKLFAVRASNKNNRISVKWAKRCNNSIVPKSISGIAFLNSIYEILDWNLLWKYKVTGTYCHDNTDGVLLFDMNDAEALMVSKYPDSNNENKDPSEDKKRIIGYPADWIADFGTGYYTHAQVNELKKYFEDGNWGIDNDGTVYANWNLDEEVPVCYNGNKPAVTPLDEVKQYIPKLKEEIKRNVENE